tara:strand:- start:292 stop:432 length:141 start_codon:yes stop_codon:yes gene_type:complete
MMTVIMSVVVSRINPGQEEFIGGELSLEELSLEEFSLRDLIILNWK